ncbi:hypothetical protein [Bradyrhizobium sp.]|uniref:hypothetical protein n=1 Tax=Bradyrhizobium sp. TaxID=376 RepID=UPI0039C8AA2D
MRRAEIGIRHHIASAYLLRCARESSWRENNRRTSNGRSGQSYCRISSKCGIDLATGRGVFMNSSRVTCSGGLDNHGNPTASSELLNLR